MFKRILVPLDESKLAEEALPFAADLIDESEGEFLLARVCDLPSGAMVLGSDIYNKLLRGWKDNAENYLERMCGSLDSQRPIHKKVLTGHAIEELLAQEGKFGADLILMTTHGESGLERWFLGSVAEGLARRAECPVLIIRSGGNLKPPLGKKIVVPLDGSAFAEQVLPLAVSMAQRTQGELVLVRAHQDSASYEFMSHDLYPDREDAKNRRTGEQIAQQYLEDTQSALKELYPKLAVSTKLSRAEAAGAILEEGESSGADLIAMTSHGATGPGKWIFGSVAEKLLRHSDCPVLVVKSRKETGEGKSVSALAALQKITTVS